MPEYSDSRQEKTDGVEKKKSMDFDSAISNVWGIVIKTTVKFRAGLRYFPTDSDNKVSKVGPHVS